MPPQMLCGILDKKQIGSSAKGLIHAVQEVYGGEVAGELLSALGKLFTEMVKHSAHTFGIEDVLLTSDGERTRTKLLSEARSCGPAEAARYVDIDGVAWHGKLIIGLDGCVSLDARAQWTMWGRTLLSQVYKAGQR